MCRRRERRGRRGRREQPPPAATPPRPARPFVPGCRPGRRRRRSAFRPVPLRVAADARPAPCRRPGAADGGPAGAPVGAARPGLVQDVLQLPDQFLARLPLLPAVFLEQRVGLLLLLAGEAEVFDRALDGHRAGRAAVAVLLRPAGRRGPRPSRSAGGSRRGPPVPDPSCGSPARGGPAWGSGRWGGPASSAAGAARPGRPPFSAATRARPVNSRRIRVFIVVPFPLRG